MAIPSHRNALFFPTMQSALQLTVVEPAGLPNPTSTMTVNGFTRIPLDIQSCVTQPPRETMPTLETTSSGSPSGKFEARGMMGGGAPIFSRTPVIEQSSLMSLEGGVVLGVVFNECGTISGLMAGSVLSAVAFHCY